MTKTPITLSNRNEKIKKRRARKLDEWSEGIFSKKIWMEVEIRVTEDR